MFPQDGGVGVSSDKYITEGLGFEINALPSKLSMEWIFSETTHYARMPFGKFAW